MIEQVKALITHIGGKENIVTVSHCMTRLRFVLVDESIVDKEAIESLKLVKGVFNNAGQFQVIIGNNVHEIYNELIKQTGLETASKEDVKRAGAKKQNKLQQIATFMSEIFAPIIPALIVGGLILGFRNMMEIPFGIFGDVALTDLNQFWSGLHSFLWLIGEAVFHFLPVYVTWATVKRIGGTEILGLVLGITLVSPQLLNAYAVGGGDIPFWDFGFFQMNMIGYQAQVIPAIMVGLFAGYLEIGLRKITPNSIKMIIIPFVVILLGAFVAHAVIGPIGWTIGAALGTFIIWLFETLGVFAGALFGFFYAPLVITGLHHTTIAIDSQIIADTGTTFIWPIIALSNIAQGAAVAGIIMVRKGLEDREVAIPSLISAWLGVTEPAMFGVNIKYGFPFICGMIGAGVAGGYATLTNIQAFSIGVGGLPGFLSISASSMMNFFIAMIIAIVIPFVLVIAYSKKPNAFKTESK